MPITETHKHVLKRIREWASTRADPRFDDTKCLEIGKSLGISDTETLGIIRDLKSQGYIEEVTTIKYLITQEGEAALSRWISQGL